MTIRIGCGFDAHALVGGRDLILGGVKIPLFAKGLAGHSDGDALSHALCDALFGACALGDIGTHFPDSDDTYKNADSIQLLCRAAAIADEKRGARLINADATIAVQAPKLAPYIPEMRRRIAAALRADDSQIGIKATTTDALGFVGRGEGAAVFAVVLLEIKNDG